LNLNATRARAAHGNGAAHASRHAARAGATPGGPQEGHRDGGRPGAAGGGGGRGEGKRGGAHLGIRRSAATVHQITPRAREVEEREREVAAREKKNERERRGCTWGCEAPGGTRQGWARSGHGPSQTAGRVGNPLLTLNSKRN
jgi:hypothetical protein